MGLSRLAPRGKKYLLYVESALERGSNYGLLICLLFVLLVVPVMQWALADLMMDIGINLIILLSLGAVSNSRTRKGLFLMGGIIVAIWIGILLNFPLLRMLAYLLTVWMLFSTIVVFIKSVARRSEISEMLIVEAINGYLLLGLGFSILVTILSVVNPQSFTFSAQLVAQGGVDLVDSIYFSFVTLATLGYGDLLPLTPLAKSVSIFIALCGQIYQVTIMAFLMGKLISKWQRE